MYVFCVQVHIPVCTSVYVYVKAYIFDKNRIIEYSSILLLIVDLTNHRILICCKCFSIFL